MKSTFLKISGLIAIAGFMVSVIISVSYSDQSWTGNNNAIKELHPLIYDKWQNSHHKKSMLEATENTVFGDFNNKNIEINGVRTSFFKKKDEFWVNTADVAGTPREYKIEYVFGFEPLQQYLVQTENGKYQVLPFSWDSRDESRGGQRWFHIYGEDHIPFNDRLHWTQPLQNWNGMCADCHSTDLKRNYNADENKFNTDWKTVNISCGSCHTDPDYLDFKSSTLDAGWSFIEGQNTAEWTGEQRPKKEIEVCAACHSRRTPLTDGFIPDGKFLDHFTPTLIRSPEYFPDGQVKEEDYVWGSFLQSKMFSKGVICSDCHDPHSLKLKASGNALCSGCHLPEYFDTPSHHNHKIGTKAAECVTCHMPETTFMQVDVRNDHSFRIPRPDLAHNTASPNVCTSCHDNFSSEDAANIINSWPNAISNRPAHYGEIFNDVMNNAPGGEQKLKELIYDDEIPTIIRASGFSLLNQYPSEDTVSHIIKGLSAKEPLIRLGAVRATGFIPPDRKESILRPLLSDEFRAIRIEAYEAIGNEQISSPAKEEFLEATEQVMWRGEGRYNLALFHQRNGDIDSATENYLSAQNIDPYFPASYINLADLFRAQGNENSSGTILDRGLAVTPDDPGLNFSKALHLVRAKRTTEALDHLSRAVGFAPGNARYAYVYGVALRDLGQPAKALAILTKANEKNSNDANINMLLLEIYRADGNWKEALKYAENLSKLHPNNITINRIKADLKNKIGINQ